MDMYNIMELYSKHSLSFDGPLDWLVLYTYDLLWHMVSGRPAQYRRARKRNNKNDGGMKEI